ncbi:MAG: hypothetical protein ABUL66_01720 [Verrucomicrobiota bacterium]
MGQSRFITKHVVNLPKSGVRDLIMANPPQLNGRRWSLIPSNSMGLENALDLCFGFNPVEFDGIRILKGDSDFKGLEFVTFRNLNHVVFHN